MRIVVVAIAGFVLSTTGGAAANGRRCGLPANVAPYGDAVVFDAASGRHDARFPIVCVGSAAAADDHGGFYLGAGSVGGRHVGGVVHLRADGRLDPTFRASVRGGVVHAVAVSGRRVYLGGSFTRVDDRARLHAAAVNGRTGVVLPWAVRPIPQVGMLTVVGGNVVAGSIRHLAAFDASRGTFRWSLDADDSAEAQVAAGRRLFVGGTFMRLRRPRGRWIRVGSRSVPAAVDPRTGAVLRWRASRSVGDEIFSLAATGTTLLVAGHESGYRIDLRTGRVLGRLRGSPAAVAAAKGRIYLGGNCRDEVLWNDRNNLAALDAATGRLTRFAPKLTRYQCVQRIVVSGSNVLVLGQFLTTLG